MLADRRDRRDRRRGRARGRGRAVRRCSSRAGGRSSSRRSRPRSAAARSWRDLAAGDGPARLRRGGRARRRARRQRGAARVGRAHVVLARGARPGARREPARADRARAAAGGDDGRAPAPATSCSSPRCRASRRGPRSSLYSATKFGLRGFSLGAAAGPRGRTASASPACSPGSSATPGMFADVRRVAAARASGPCTPEAVAAGIVSAIERNRAEVDVAPLGAAAGRARGGRRAGPRRVACSASWAAHQVARAIARRPARAALSDAALTETRRRGTCRRWSPRLHARWCSRCSPARRSRSRPT